MQTTLSSIDSHANRSTYHCKSYESAERVIDIEEADALLKNFPAHDEYKSTFTEGTMVPSMRHALTDAQLEEMWAFGERHKVWADMDMDGVDVDEFKDMLDEIDDWIPHQIAWMLDRIMQMQQPRDRTAPCVGAKIFPMMDSVYDVLQIKYLENPVEDDEKGEVERELAASTLARITGHSKAELEQEINTFGRSRRTIRGLDDGYRLKSGVDFRRLYMMMRGIYFLVRYNTVSQLDIMFPKRHFTWIVQAQFEEKLKSARGAPQTDCFDPNRAMENAQFEPHNWSSADTEQAWKGIFEHASRNRSVPVVAMKQGEDSRHTMEIWGTDESFMEEVVPGFSPEEYNCYDREDSASPPPPNFDDVPMDRIVQTMIDESGQFFVGTYLYRVQHGEDASYRAYVSYLNFRFRIRSLGEIREIMRRLSFMLVVDGEGFEVIGQYSASFCLYPSDDGRVRCVFMNREVFECAERELENAGARFAIGSREDYKEVFGGPEDDFVLLDKSLEEMMRFVNGPVSKMDQA